MSGRGEGLARHRADAVAAAHLVQQRVVVLAGIAVALFVPIGDVVESGRDGDSTVSTHLLGALLYWLGIDPEEIAEGGSSVAESLGRGLGLGALVVLAVGLGLTFLVVVRWSGENGAERSVQIAGGVAVATLVLGVVGFWVANRLVSTDEYQISTAWGLVVPVVVAVLLVRLRRDHVDLS